MLTSKFEKFQFTFKLHFQNPIRIPGSRIPDPGSGIPDPGSGIPDPGSGIPDPESGIPYHGSWIPDPGSRIRDFEKIKIGIQNLNLENPRPGAGLLFFLTLNIFDFKTEEPSGGADPESKAVSEVQGLVTDTMRKSRHGVGSGIGARIRDLRPGPRSMMRSWMRDPRLGLGSGTGSTGQGTSRIRCLIPDVGHGGGHDETSFNLYADQRKKNDLADSENRPRIGRQAFGTSEAEGSTSARVAGRVMAAGRLWGVITHSGALLWISE